MDRKLFYVRLIHYLLVSGVSFDGIAMVPNEKLGKGTLDSAWNVDGDGCLTDS